MLIFIIIYLLTGFAFGLVLLKQGGVGYRNYYTERKLTKVFIVFFCSLVGFGMFFIWLFGKAKLK